MTTARPPTILCVDDDDNALTLRKLVLEQAGYNVLPASDAAAALKLFNSHTIHLVISDHLLPDLTGIELTREMKLRRPFVPMILISGVTELPADAEHADLFLDKAGGTTEMLQSVADLLRRSRISEGKYFAEIRCDKRFNPVIWHYTIQRVRTCEIIAWSQACSETTAIHEAREQMREMNLRRR